jgi:sugar/nucleoside kinase (ribokinase family)
MVDIACEVDNIESLTIARGSDYPSRATLSPGGSAANTATWLARAGNNVYLIGAVGADPLGDYLINEIGGSGVHMLVQRVPGELTGVCLILNETDGQRTMIPSAGANARFDDSQLIDTLAASNITHLHVSAYMLFHDLSGITALAYMEAARRVGATISLDPASSALLADNQTRLVAALAMTDVLLANADEALEITRLLSKDELVEDTIDLDLISTALHQTSPIVVVTDGPEPVRALVNRVHNFTSSVAKIGCVKSTTGAGDAFNAGYLNAWLAGSDIPASIAAGTILAGSVLGEVGATTLTSESAPI